MRSSTSRSGGGTSPAAMRSAKPSTTAVLPTPASPVRIGLFWRRRVRMSITWRISASRPRMGSILPARALAVRSMVNWSSAAVPRGAAGARAAPPAAGAGRFGAACRARRRSRGAGGPARCGPAPATRRARGAPGRRPPAAPRAGGRSARGPPLLQRGEQPGLLGQLDRCRATAPGARALPVFSRSSARFRSAPSRPASTSPWRRMAARRRPPVEQLQQPVLDLDVVVAARQGQPGGGFQGAADGVVQGGSSGRGGRRDMDYPSMTGRRLGPMARPVMLG